MTIASIYKNFTFKLFKKSSWFNLFIVVLEDDSMIILEASVDDLDSFNKFDTCRSAFSVLGDGHYS